MDIFVGSIPFKLKEKELRELFEKYGEVTSLRIVKDKFTRQNKGFGFVEMLDEDAVRNAIHPKKRNITVPEFIGGLRYHRCVFTGARVVAMGFS